MRSSNDLHQQFAEFFPEPALRPYAWLLSQSLSEGHICLELGKLEEKRAELPAWYQQGLSVHPSALSLVAKDGREDQPFVLKNERLYLQRYFRYESRCLNRILEFLPKERELSEGRMRALQEQQDMIRRLFPEGSGTGPDWQMAAAINGVLNNFSIITGGPGTGKTTTVARLLAILYQLDPGMRVALAAPTGKAAARMAESLRNNRIDWLPGFSEKLDGLSPATLHRLLRVRAGTPYFQHNAQYPLPFDVVIVDEASMIDVALFAKLLDAIGADTRLILLGDKDQLASVEAGSLLGDLCVSGNAVNQFPAARLELMNSLVASTAGQYPETALAVGAEHPLTGHIVELQHSHRFSDHAGIGRLSRAVLQNDVEALHAVTASGDPEIRLDYEYDSRLCEQFIEGYRNYIEESDTRLALKAFGNLRVLCALREGPQGVYELNKAIEARLHELRLIRANTVFYKNRPVILTRNYYEHGLFNGDTGLLRPDANGTLMAWFEDSSGSLKAVAPGFLDDAETAFAMTIHKSQGSEFSEVLMMLPKHGGASLLTRELLYTGITRAKKHVLVQSAEEVFIAAMARRVQRASGISERLEQAEF